MWQGKILEFRKYSLKGFARKQIDFKKQKGQLAS